MIATDESDSVGVSHFETKEEEERFERVEASVNEVAWGTISPALCRM